MPENTNTSELRYAVLVDSDDYIAILSPEGIRKFVNKSYCKYLNKPSSELINKPFHEDLPVNVSTIYTSLLKSITRSSPTVSSTQKTGIPDATEWISWKATGIYDGDTLIEIIAIGRNANDMFAIQKEKEILANTLNAFKKAIDTNIICTITNDKGIITYVNDNFCKISQYTHNEIIGQTHNIVNSGFHTKQFFAELWETIKGGKMWTGEIKNKAKDGSFYWVNSVIIPIKDSNEEITGYLSLRILINDQKKAEEEKTIYLKSLEDMLFMVSHEIRKPLTNCQGVLNMMRDDLLSSKEEFTEAISHLIISAAELDSYSRKLNDHIRKNLAFSGN